MLQHIQRKIEIHGATGFFTMEKKNKKEKKEEEIKSAFIQSHF